MIGSQKKKWHNLGNRCLSLFFSVIDYIFRVLGMEYMGRTDFIHKPIEGDNAFSRIKEARKDEKSGTIHSSRKPSSPSASPADSFVSAEGPASDFNEEAQVLGPEVKTGVALSDHLAQMMGDAPVCNSCGHITVRNGSCYKCLNCGNSIGCS